MGIYNRFNELTLPCKIKMIPSFKEAYNFDQKVLNLVPGAKYSNLVPREPHRREVPSTDRTAQGATA